jgi:prepilin-type N-terminal cleavage/methylation domain-containing protein
MHTPSCPTTRPFLRDRRGVSLLEVMMVIVIGGLLASMAIPRFANLTSAWRSMGATSQVAADIAYTRMMAVREGRTVSMTIASNVYTIVAENTDGSARRTLRTVRIQDNFPGTTLAVDGGVGRFAFDSRGVLKANSGTGITVARNSRSQHLAVTAIGRVTRDAAQ